MRTFVSRAGEKLQHALDTFNIDVSGKTCADFGCSTGGFTDCLLRNGATKVYSVDTGYGVLDWKLRQDPMVIVMERTNALHVRLPEKVEFISIDVGWTPQRLIVPAALKNIKEDGDIVSLLKPHYEAGGKNIRDGKLSEDLVSGVVQNVAAELEKASIKVLEIVESPITGKRGGNTEYLLWIRK